MLRRCIIIKKCLMLNVNDKVISMRTLIIKALQTSLSQREGNYPSLVKRGEGRFFNNVILLITALVYIQNKCRFSLSGRLRRLAGERIFFYNIPLTPFIKGDETRIPNKS